jgi:FliI/YscN family ATPase
VIAPERLPLGTCALGRALDWRGLPLDNLPPPQGRNVTLTLRSPRPNERTPIATPLWTGVRVLDGLLTIGRGARFGIFGPPGAGKTTLVEAIVDNCSADAVVVALVGERGREAQRWLERLDERTTVVCATSDRSSGERRRAAQVAIAHAAALRDRGLHVLFVLDSLARFAAAMREIGATAGESVGRGGYPPSVFAEMARLVEVAGSTQNASMTLVATVIYDGDERDPVSEAARSLMDGHVALSAKLAEAGRFPAVDVLASASRTMEAVVSERHRRDAASVRRALALLDRVEDARALGIQPEGMATRAAVAVESRIEVFLRQGRGAAPAAATVAELALLAQSLEVGDDDR